MTTSPGSDVCGLFCVKEGGASSACAALLVTSRLGTADRQLQPVGQHPAVLLADCSRVSAVAGRRQANATTMTTAKTATAPIRAINPSGGPSSGSGAGGAVAVAVGVGMGSVIGPRVGCSTTGSRVGSTWTTPQYPA